MTRSEKTVSLPQIHCALRRLGGFSSVYIPEFTFRDLRIDALVLDTSKRWARGFEIKMSRADYLRDEKWQLYTQFCSSLSIVCPAGLIQKHEVDDPFGLLWVAPTEWGGEAVRWEKRPRRFQRRDGLAWLYTYVRILEAEMPRLVGENERLRTKLLGSEPDGRESGAESALGCALRAEPDRDESAH